MLIHCRIDRSRSNCPALELHLFLGTRSSSRSFPHSCAVFNTVRLLSETRKTLSHRIFTKICTIYNLNVSILHKEDSYKYKLKENTKFLQFKKIFK